MEGGSRRRVRPQVEAAGPLPEHIPSARERKLSDDLTKPNPFMSGSPPLEGMDACAPHSDPRPHVYTRTPHPRPPTHPRPTVRAPPRVWRRPHGSSRWEFGQ